MIQTVVCPACKHRLDRQPNAHACISCGVSYLEIDAIPILILPNESDLTRREREYWNARFEKEGVFLDYGQCTNPSIRLMTIGDW